MSTLYKKAGTLANIKESGEKFLKDNGTGLAIGAGLGGLAGYLYDQSSKDRAASLLRSILLTGGGAAAGMGAYGLAKALTSDKPLVDLQEPENDADLVSGGPIHTPLAIGAGLAAGAGTAKLHNMLWKPETVELQAKLDKELDKSPKDRDSDIIARLRKDLAKAKEPTKFYEAAKSRPARLEAARSRINAGVPPTADLKALRQELSDLRRDPNPDTARIAEIRQILRRIDATDRINNELLPKAVEAAKSAEVPWGYTWELAGRKAAKVGEKIPGGLNEAWQAIKKAPGAAWRHRGDIKNIRLKRPTLAGAKQLTTNMWTSTKQGGQTAWRGAKRAWNPIKAGGIRGIAPHLQSTGAGKSAGWAVGALVTAALSSPRLRQSIMNSLEEA